MNAGEVSLLPPHLSRVNYIAEFSIYHSYKHLLTFTTYLHVLIILHHLKWFKKLYKLSSLHPLATFLSLLFVTEKSCYTCGSVSSF